MNRRAQAWQESGGFFEWSPPGTTDARGPVRIFHAERGDPEAQVLLLVHGFPTSSVDWCDVADGLAQDHRVCMLDLPGFGFSDKPRGARYTIESDALLVAHYLEEILGARSAAVVAHDRGDSVALAFASACARGETPLTVTHLVLSNGNMFLPLSNLTVFQRMLLDPASAPQVLGALTPQVLAEGLGATTFTPPRAPGDPTVAALTETFAVGDGIAVLHDTIQYLVERSRHEEAWLAALARLAVPTTLVWGLYDTISPLRVATHVWNHCLATKPGKNAFHLLPRANHYLQNDQPQEFIEVIRAALEDRLPQAPGPFSEAPGAPILLDLSRARLPTAQEALAGAGDPAGAPG